jgi:hypothetical protein
MAIALLDNIDAAPGANGGTTSAIDTTGANLLLFGIGSYGLGTNGSESPTDSKSNSWSGTTLRVAGDVAARIFYGEPSSVGSGHDFSYADANCYAVLAASAFSGAQSSPLDQQNGATGGMSTSQSPGSVTPTEDNELVVTCLTFDRDSGGITPPTGFTLLDSQEYSSGVNMGFAIAYKIQTTAATETPNWTTGSSVVWASSVVTFKGTGGSPPGEFSASASFVVAAAEFVGVAAFEAGTKTASASLTAKAATIAANATFDDELRTAAASLVAPAAGFAGDATFAPGTKTATASLTAAAAGFAGSVTFEEGTKTASAALTADAATFAGSAAFTPEGAASASLTAAAATVAIEATFAPGTKTAAAALVCDAAQFAGVATFEDPIYAAAAQLVAKAATFSGAAISSETPILTPPLTGRARAIGGGSGGARPISGGSGASRKISGGT